ncbi:MULTISPECIES: hypothetical protein [Burkholderia]|uniref:Uncharacterized protein n=1 Tax=Burkholderia pyrrocinia TaxID=60550 RepID=A0A318JBC3_BURPY|nr:MULTISPECIES: hypothetical protein [Burkholderia]PXX41108.1 hypothetical protein NA66_1001718 [Burkholderia pyrrocinia]SFW58337.1 hypothetical protein SAMN03159384_03034 [Burkholderia sp. NFACC33-1]SFY11685.1 hypothetical protein SAMN03159408_03246 [Burkholderia sp. NFPP32]
MKKFRVGAYSSSIEEREVSKETASTVTWIDRWRDQAVERKERKVTTMHRWFETWADAKAWLIERAELDVISARRKLKQANARLGNAKSLKAPSEAA